MVRRILLLLAFSLLVASTAFTAIGAKTRAEGQAALADVLARHEAAGYGTTFSDLAATAPPVDRDRQLRLREWMKQPSLRSVSFSVDRDLAWRLEEGGSPALALREAHEERRADMQTLESLFEEGDLCLTSMGWLPEHPESASFADRAGGWIPNLLRMREAYNWYAVETAMAEDPTHALTMLQRLHESMARPGCLIDSMIAVACDATRDDAMVVLALSGRYPYAWLDAWLDEPSRSARLVADGLKGERLRLGGPLGVDLAAGRSLKEHLGAAFELGDFTELWSGHIRPWAHAASECATYLEGMVALERRVLGEIDEAELTRKLETCDDLGRPFDLMMPNRSGMLVSASASAERHRFIRAALVLALEGQTREGPPASQDEATAWIRELRPHLLPAEGESALLYERVGVDRFRMAIDLYDDGNALRRGEAAADRPLDLRHAFVEIRIP